MRSGGPWNLAFRWLWGSPDLKNRSSDVVHDGDDELTQPLIKSTSMADARSTIAAECAWSGKKKGRADCSTTKNRHGDDLNYLQMAGVYASDLGGLVIGKEDRKVQGVLGSYVLDDEIVKTKGDTLTVEYKAWTDINNESFVPGHQGRQEGFNEAPRTWAVTSPGSASTSSGRNDLQVGRREGTSWCATVAAVLVLSLIGLFALVRCGANEGGEAQPCAGHRCLDGRRWRQGGVRGRRAVRDVGHPPQCRRLRLHRPPAG
ncbi:hypothetical protein SGRIM128S_05352 [Streptomyces griseomycini]